MDTKKNTRIALISVFLYSLGSLMLNPYFAVYVSDNLAYGLAFSGLLITIKVFTQRFFVLVGGGLSDRIGSVHTLRISMVVRITSFSLLILTPTRPGLLMVAVLNGVGTALFNPSVRSFLYSQHQNNDSELKRIISLRNAIFNTGAAIGPIVGLFLLSYSIVAVCIISIIMYLIILIMLFTINASRPLKNKHSRSLGLELVSFFRNHEIYPILLLQMGFSALYSHFEYLLPIYLTQLAGKSLVTIAFSVNTILVITCQLFLKKWVHQIPQSILFGCLALFCLFMGISDIASFRMVSHYVIALAAIVLLSIGEIGLIAKIDYMAAKNNSENMGMSFGWLSMFAALAVMLANYVNSQLVHWFSFQVMWLTNFSLTVAVLLGYSLFHIKSITPKKGGEVEI